MTTETMAMLILARKDAAGFRSSFFLLPQPRGRRHGRGGDAGTTTLGWLAFCVQGIEAS